jgi:glycerol-3-phosphate acyltransferase PlsX
MRIAVDAMGGDNAPKINIEGALYCARDAHVLGIEEIIMVGPKDLLEENISHYHLDGLPLRIKDAKDVIASDEAPAIAVRNKPDSSIVVATKLVKEGEADALLSAGHTGAVMAAALMGLGRLHGINRPAIAALIPNLKGVSVLIDVGANVDCKPKHLYQFAIMGNVYAHYILGIERPRIGILSIGHEKTKGNELTFESYKLLENTPLNFMGNIEGRDITNGNVDVIVCDGFIGNTLLKFGESLAEMILRELKEEISRGWWLKLGSQIFRPGFRNFKRRVDYSEYGGAPLLGVNGVVTICHGSSSSRAIKNGIKVAAEFVNHQVNRHIEEAIRE